MTTIIVVVVVALVFFVAVCVVSFMVWKRESEMRTDSIKAIEENLEKLTQELSRETHEMGAEGQEIFPEGPDVYKRQLQLKEVIVTNIECRGCEMHIWLRMEQRMHFCPCCGTITSKIHDYRTQLVKDVSISGYNTILHLRKRRHVCPECGKRFDEHIDFLPRYRHFTNRVSMQIFEQLKECRSTKSIAKPVSYTHLTGLWIRLA